ncbi:MAG: flagellar biosynthesis protein FliQ [Verrucomicrobiia bacterium]|jgi:flagellar biosynthetic protein FliQ
MTPEYAVDLLKQLMTTSLMIAMPILLTALAIGMLVSLFQAVTSIQEQTLTFVPKALGVVGLLIILLPWMMRTMIEFTTLIIQKLPEMAR